MNIYDQTNFTRDICELPLLIRIFLLLKNSLITVKSQADFDKK